MLLLSAKFRKLYIGLSLYWNFLELVGLPEELLACNNNEYFLIHLGHFSKTAVFSSTKCHEQIIEIIPYSEKCI